MFKNIQSILIKFFLWENFKYIYLLFLCIIISTISYNFFLPESLRLDESQSIWQANRSFWGMLEITSRDVHMPLYNILLNIWINVFGNNIFTNRILSLLFFLASVLMIFKVTQLSTKKVNVGLYVATLFALSPFMNWFGNELRMYSMLVFFTLCSHYFFLRIFQSTKSSWRLWLGYVLTVLLGSYSHYFFILFVFCQITYYLFNQKLFEKSAKTKFLGTLVVLALSILPWILYVKRSNSASTQAPSLLRPSTVDLFNIYSNHFFGFQVDTINSLILSIWPLLGILFLYFLQKRKEKKHEPSLIGKSTNKKNIFSSYLYFGVMAFLPTIFLFLVSVTARPVFLSRYLIMSLAPTYILLGCLLYSYKGFVLRIIRYGLVFGMIGALFSQIISPDTTVKENYREAINSISSIIKDGDVLAISTPFTIYPFYYYYKNTAKLITLPEWDLNTTIPKFTQASLDLQFDEFSTKYEKMYLVLSYDQGYEKKIKETADKRFKMISEKNFSSKLNLYVYEVKKEIIEEPSKERIKQESPEI